MEFLDAYEWICGRLLKKQSAMLFGQLRVLGVIRYSLSQ